jgi:hypothetical protein
MVQVNPSMPYDGAFKQISQSHNGLRREEENGKVEKGRHFDEMP